MHIIDLSHTIESLMQVFPGTPPVRVAPLASVDEDGYSEKQLHLTSHVGTHVDVPAHLHEDGRCIETMLPEHFVGQGICLKLAGEPGLVIHRRHLAPFEEKIRLAEFLLLSTGWDRLWGSSSYAEEYPVLSRDAAAYLASFPLKGVGVDTISVDPVNSVQLVAHNLLLERMVIVENLTGLEQLGDEPFLFSCLPLKIAGGDGSPVRAVAIFG